MPLSRTLQDKEQIFGKKDFFLSNDHPKVVLHENDEVKQQQEVKNDFLGFLNIFL